MSFLENFKNILRSAYGGATGFKCNFFFQICNEVPGGKKNKPCRPWAGRQAPVAQPTCDRRWARPTVAAGGLSPPAGDWGLPPYKSPSPPLPSSFEPENSTKNPEKKERSEEKESGEALPDSALVICRLVHLV